MYDIYIYIPLCFIHAHTLYKHIIYNIILIGAIWYAILPRQRFTNSGTLIPADLLVLFWSTPGAGSGREEAQGLFDHFQSSIVKHADGDFGTHSPTGYWTIFCPPFPTGRPCPEQGWLEGLHLSVWRMPMRIYGRSKRLWRTRWQLEFYNAFMFTFTSAFVFF